MELNRTPIRLDESGVKPRCHLLTIANGRRQGDDLRLGSGMANPGEKHFEGRSTADIVKQMEFIGDNDSDALHQPCTGPQQGVEFLARADKNVRILDLAGLTATIADRDSDR